MPKPLNYPLPWCEALDWPYWRVNIGLCLIYPGWREYQRGKSMTNIIPHIDQIVNLGLVEVAEIYLKSCDMRFLALKEEGAT